jgi:hypothetical protein
MPTICSHSHPCTPATFPVGTSPGFSPFATWYVQLYDGPRSIGNLAEGVVAGGEPEVGVTLLHLGHPDAGLLVPVLV